MNNTPPPPSQDARKLNQIHWAPRVNSGYDVGYRTQEQIHERACRVRVEELEFDRELRGFYKEVWD